MQINYIKAVIKFVTIYYNFDLKMVMKIFLDLLFLCHKKTKKFPVKLLGNN